MKNLSEKINGVELKIRQLALKLERIENERNSLLIENKKLKNDLSSRSARVNELEYKFANAQRVLEKKRENNGTESSEKLRKEIDQYIKEIDKCIEWLQNS